VDAEKPGAFCSGHLYLVPRGILVSHVIVTPGALRDAAKADSGRVMTWPFEIARIQGGFVYVEFAMEGNAALHLSFSPLFRVSGNNRRARI